MYKACR